MTYDDVARVAADLPEAVELDRRGQRTWAVRGKTFAWQRPYTKADIKRFGEDTPPDGDILAVHVADLGEKEAVLASGLKGVFTMSHFDGYPAVLVQLNSVARKSLRELLVDGWLDLAPAATAREYAEREGLRGL
jgi:hypothetical protein